MAEEQKDEEIKSDTRQRRAVTVDPPEERATRLKKYLVYRVTVEPQLPGVVSVFRRYSDFVWLRESLARQYPGMFIPPLPAKKMFGNFAEDFVEERRVDLERFLNRVEDIEPFPDNNSYLMFLSRPEATFQEGAKQIDGSDASRKSTIKSMGSIFQRVGLQSANPVVAAALDEKSKSLCQLYPELHSEELHEEAEQDLVRIKEFFEKTRAQLQTAHNCCFDVLKAYTTSKTESQLLHNNLSELYHVEQNYPYRDSPSRLDVADEFQQWAKFHEQQEKYFKRYILRNIRYELQDVESILEQIRRIEEYQVQFARTHQRCEKWRKNEKELTEKQQNDKQNDFNEERSLRELCDICIKIVLLNDVESVWNTKIEAFKTDMYEYSNKAMQYYNTIADVWNQVDVKKEVPKEE